MGERDGAAGGRPAVMTSALRDAERRGQQNGGGRGPGSGAAALAGQPRGGLGGAPRPWPVAGGAHRPRSTAASLDGINRAVVDRIIRVDHAGEYGANRIYAGQMAVLGRSAAGPVIQVGLCGQPLPRHAAARGRSRLPELCAW